MKNFKSYLSFVAVFALLFTSCSKEENNVAGQDSDMATLSFGAIVNDLVTNRAATKQTMSDFPACSNDDPAYVEIILMQGNTAVVGSAGNAHRVDLVAGQVFTQEDEELELEPGNYTLDHFAVFNAAGDLIWLAPRTGSAFGDYVDHALPLSINLQAGVKKYVDVSVLCYDNRDVNQYGYLFFDLDLNTAVEFCIFVNYCDENGRHYPARYRVDVWLGTDASGTPLYTNGRNQTGQYSNGDFYATPLCGVLPSNDDPDEDYVFYRITLLDWPAAYGNVTRSTIEGTLSMNDIINNFGGDGEVNYEHLRFGCD